MRIFQRVRDILSANLNDLVDRFEDPERMLRQAIREMETTIAKVTAAAARSIAAERLLSGQVSSHRDEAAAWHARAAAALRGADESLARRALGRKREHESLAGALDEQLAATHTANESLRRQLDAMRAKHAEARRKLAMLCARQAAVVARRQASGDVGRDGFDAGVFARFRSLEQRIDESEAEADALAELQLATDPLAEEIHHRDEQLALDADLAELQAELRGGGSG